MSNRNRNPGPLPARWLHCPRKSFTLIADKFLALKTPLDSRFDDQVPIDCRFPPKMLFDSCKSKKINIGLWIDLTNTDRFYDRNEVEEMGAKYHKLQCRGHGETPSREQTDFFIKLVHNFISKFPLKTIAVHCTHGFNRTGFLIVSYLVERMDCSLDIAMDMFARARPVGIYKGDYIEELYKRYDSIEDMPPPPNLPSWHTESDDTADYTPSTSQEDNSGGRSRGKFGKEVSFMKGVPGVFHVTDRQKAFYLQKKIQNMCKWGNKNFPGSQPVSMDQQNMTLLGIKPYRVSWKADGMRYMMLIDGEDQVYFFDRDNNVFKVERMRFLHLKDLRTHLTNTLLDGEMVIDTVNGEEIPRYLVYDIVRFDDKDVGKLPFYPIRQQCIENEIIKPRYIAIQKGIINKNAEPFSVRKKEFWPITQAHQLLGEKFARTLSHEPDGLIFQPSNEPYVAGTCPDVLKWKPLELNSIDFRLKIAKQEGQGIISTKVGYLFVGQLDRPFGFMKWTKAIKNLDNKIIECKYENGEWKFMRERTDKSFPNSYKTAEAVMESIKNPVTKELLFDYIHRCRFDDDSEIMPPPSKRIHR